MPKNMERIGNVSLSSRIYEKLRQSLIFGDYVPDERLVMQDLAEQLGTSVTPVREAALRLVSEGALELRSGRFVTIPAFTLNRYWQIRIIRIQLERLATSIAAENCSLADLEQLEAIHTDFVKHEKDGDIGGARRLNQQFHFAVYQLSGMDILVRQIESLWASMGPILNVYYQQADSIYVGADEHLRIIAAMRNHDGATAADAVEADIVRGGEKLLKLFDKMKS